MQGLNIRHFDFSKEGRDQVLKTKKGRQIICHPFLYLINYIFLLNKLSITCFLSSGVPPK